LIGKLKMNVMKEKKEKNAIFRIDEYQLTEWERKFVREVQVLMKMTLPELMRVEQTGIPLSRY